MSNTSYKDYLTTLSEHMKNTDIHLSPEDLDTVFKCASEAMISMFRKSPYVSIEPIGVFEVSSLVKRRHVLRGVSYESHTRYKVKVNIPESTHDALCEIYDKYREDD